MTNEELDKHQDDWLALIKKCRNPSSKVLLALINISAILSEIAKRLPENSK